jgi:hypothetical protein
MVYRGWKISAYATFLGFFAQFTSPLGQPHQTSTGFPTDEHAISYARARIDYLLDCQRLCLEGVQAAPSNCS